MRKLLCLAAILPTLALAAPDPAMVAALDSCLTGPQDRSDARACIGILATKCMDTPSGQTTFGMMQCAMAEAEAWDVLLNREYQNARKLAQRMDSADRTNSPEYAIRADKLLAAQRAWIAFRDANCASEYAVWGAGSMRQIMSADCHLQMTAERTIALHGYHDIVQ